MRLSEKNTNNYGTRKDANDKDQEIVINMANG